MTRSSRRTRAQWESAFSGARRACYAGLDATALRVAFGARTAQVMELPHWSVALTDPATGLLAHTVTDGWPEEFASQWVRELHPQAEALHYLDLARNKVLISSAALPLFDDPMRRAQLGPAVRVTLTSAQTFWGFWSFARNAGSPDFDDEELKFVARLAPHLTIALKRASLLEQRAHVPLGADESDAHLDSTPAVLMFSARGTVLHQSFNAIRVCDDLTDTRTGDARPLIPSPVAGVLAQLRWRYLHSSEDPSSPLAGTLTVRGRSGVRYAMHASYTEPDASGTSCAIVTISPVRPLASSRAIAARYGLSAREHDVLLRVAKGETTQQIAAALGLSTYTVQDHVGHACERVGVRGRRELVARLLLDSMT